MSKRIIPEDPFQLQVLLDAFAEYAEAKREHDRERESYQGYSWGYHGHSYVENMENRARECMMKLNEYIDSRVKAVIKESNA